MVILGGGGELRFFLTSARFEAFIRALDETQRHILVTGMLLASIHAPAGKIWVEKAKKQLIASVTTTVKLPQGQGTSFPHIASVELPQWPTAMDD